MTASIERVNEIASELVALVDESVKQLSELSDQEASLEPAPGKWSYKELIGHLIDSATNNHQRFVRAPNESVFVFPGYAQDDWVRQQQYNHWEWKRLLTFWQLYNHHIAHIISRIPEEKLKTECRIGTYEPATLGFVVEDYLAHMKHHLGKMPIRVHSSI